MVQRNLLSFFKEDTYVNHTAINQFCNFNETNNIFNSFPSIFYVMSCFAPDLANGMLVCFG